MIQRLRRALFAYLVPICFGVVMLALLIPLQAELYLSTENEQRLQATQTRLAAVQERLDRRQQMTCHASRERARLDENIGNLDAYTQYLMARVIAPQSKVVRDALRIQADAHVQRAKDAKKLEKDLGC